MKKSDVKILFSTIDEVLSNIGVSCDNYVGMGTDNTSVNLRTNNSIITWITQWIMNNPNGCPCHIVHNTVNKGVPVYS